MTTLITARTSDTLARYSASGDDRFFEDGTAVLADLEGAEPKVGDALVVLRPAIVRGRVTPGKPRTYRVEGVSTREASVLQRGTHVVRDVTTVNVRFVPGVRR